MSFPEVVVSVQALQLPICEGRSYGGLVKQLVQAIRVVDVKLQVGNFICNTFFNPGA